MYCCHSLSFLYVSRFVLLQGLVVVSEGLPGVWGNKGTLAKDQREQGNMSLFLGNRGTKRYKLTENILI